MRFPGLLPQLRRGAWRRLSQDPLLLETYRQRELFRRLQPWLDDTETVLLRTLRQPGEFPYRIPKPVERRVLFAIGTLGSGGAERQVLNTAEGLVRRGVDDVHLLVENMAGGDFYLPRARKVVEGVHETPGEAGPEAAAWAAAHPEFRDALTAALVARIAAQAAVLRELSPEVVHVSLDWTNVTVGIAAVLAGVPRIFLSGRNLAPVHFLFFQWFMYPAYRALLQCAGVNLLNNSEAGRRDYARWLGISPRRIRVVRNGLRLREFRVATVHDRAVARQALGLPERGSVVAGIFRLSSEKRPLLWIDAAARIRARLPDTRFLVAGVGSMSDQMAAHAWGMGLGDCVHFLGQRPDIHTVFAASDAVMQASAQEGTPNVLIEAQASGIPVVTTAAFGAREAVEDGVTGRVVRRDTAEELAAAVVSILHDEALRRALPERGPRFVEARFGFERMIDETLMAYADAGASWAARHPAAQPGDPSGGAASA